MRYLLRLVPGLCLAVLLAGPNAARAADAEKLLPDGTDMVVSFNVKQLLSSPIYQKYGKEAFQKQLQDSEEYQQFTKATGLDLEKDIERVMVGMKMPDQLGPGGNGEPEKVFGIVQGKWDAAKVTEALTSAAQKEEKLSVIKEGGRTFFKGGEDEDQPAYFTVADDSTLLFSTSKSELTAGLERLTGGQAGKIAEPLAEAWGKADTKKSFVMAMSLKGKIDPDAIPDPRGAQLLQDINAVTVALDVTEALGLEVGMNYAEADAATQAGQAIKERLPEMKQMLMFLALQQDGLQKPLSEFSKSLDVSTSGKAVTFSGKLSADGVEALGDALKALGGGIE